MIQVHASNILKNRYPGAKPFTPDENELFFGREKDIKDLYSVIFVKQTVVLYGKSGYGKSSLINAGIIPKLQEENAWILFPIRFNNYSAREQTENLTPAKNITLRLKEGLDSSSGSPLDALIPNEDSFWYWLKTYQHTFKKSQFILFFDQFEELFTYPKFQVEEFSENLSQLLYSTIPLKFRERLAELDEAGDIPDELHDFLYKKPEVKVVFSVRSDRLSQLNILTDRHSTILHNCYELGALNPEQARKAISEPAALRDPARFLTPPFSYTDDAIHKILQNIGNQQDAKIDLATLQIVCRYVEDELVNDKKHAIITSALLGDITDIFKQYYEAILNKLNPADRDKAQHLIEDELLEGGRRNPLSVTYIQNKFGLSETLLEQLEASSLLRKERDAAGRILIELSHDALVIPVSEAKTKRLQQEQEERVRYEREEKRKLAAQLQMLEKARELGGLDKKAFQLNKTETLKKNYNLFIIESKLKAIRQNIKIDWIMTPVLLFLLFCVVWSGIATYKFIHKGNQLKKNANHLEETNQGFQKLINTYDSASNPAEYKQLKDLFEKYKGLKKPK